MSRLFGSDKTKCSFFAVQVVFNAAGQEELRKRLQQRINAPGEESVDEKQAYFRNVTAVLLEAEPFFEYGYYEYITEAEAAEDTFEEWVGEIESSFASEEEEIGDEADDYHRLSAERSYIVVSLMILAEGTHPFHGKNEIDEEEIYTRAGMGTLISSLNRYNYDRAMADAVYLMPGSEEDGFSWADFADEGWKYLKMLSY
jgi:hypothetical protein